MTRTTLTNPPLEKHLENKPKIFFITLLSKLISGGRSLAWQDKVAVILRPGSGPGNPNRGQEGPGFKSRRPHHLTIFCKNYSACRWVFPGFGTLPVENIAPIFVADFHGFTKSTCFATHQKILWGG